MAEGHREFLGGAVGLVGEPVRGAARHVGNSLTTSGNVVTGLATGDVGGAATAYGQGMQNHVEIAGDTLGNQWNNIF